jgi:hypothetical protein
VEGYSCNGVLNDPKVVPKISNMLLCVNRKNLHIAFFLSNRHFGPGVYLKAKRRRHLYSLLVQGAGDVHRMMRAPCFLWAGLAFWDRFPVDVGKTPMPGWFQALF